MADRCPTCGEPVTVATGTEGTSHYESAARAEIARLEKELTECREKLDQAFEIAKRQNKKATEAERKVKRMVDGGGFA